MLNKWYAGTSNSITMGFNDPFCSDGTHFYWIPNNGKKEIFKTTINDNANALSFQMANKAETEYKISEEKA
jgi:hypothetical protein